MHVQYIAYGITSTHSQDCDYPEPAGLILFINVHQPRTRGAFKLEGVTMSGLSYHQALQKPLTPEHDLAVFHTLTKIDGDLGLQLADYYGFPEIQRSILEDYPVFLLAHRGQVAKHAGDILFAHTTELVLN